MSRLEAALAGAQHAASSAAAEQSAALATREAEVGQLREAAGHAQELLEDLRRSYASLQDQHRELVQAREVLLVSLWLISH